MPEARAARMAPAVSRLATRVSFAQFAEDIVLGRAFPGATGFYLDAGANDPVLHSVTKRFYDRGWNGVNIEPNPVVFDRLARARPRDRNLNCGVAVRPGFLTFYDFPTVDGWSTFVPELADHYRKLGLTPVESTVEVRTLASICAEHVGDRPIDFLKVDVEGYEAQLLYGGDWRRWRPRVLLIEATWFEGWEPFLLGEAGYLFATTDGINRYYVRSEDEGLIDALGTPPNVEDFFIPYGTYRELEAIGRESAASRWRRSAAEGLRSRLRRFPRIEATARRMLGRA